MKKIIFGERKNLIGENVKLLRTKHKLTQGELAAKLQVMNVNIDQQMISKIERCDRIVTDYELWCICKVLGITPNEIFEEL